MMNVGIAGTGKMGTAMARNLMDRGFAVSVWNVDRAMMEPSIAAGARAFDDIAALVSSVDATIATLWDDEVAREISLGRIVPSAPKGELLVEMSTLSPQMYETLADAAAKRELRFLACPVLGSVDNARNGTLTLFPGGSSEAFEHGRELLNAMGSTIKFTGSPAASGHLKLASNCVLATFADSMGELLALMARAGVDRALAVETLVYAFERACSKRQQFIDRDVKPRFSARALLKDLRLARAARQSLQPDSPVIECVLAEFERVASTAVGDSDYIAVALALERETGPAATPENSVP